MTVLAVVHPTELVASDLREALDERTELWDEMRLLALTAEEAGVLTQTRGQAAVVAELDDDSFAGVDVVFLCGKIAALRPLLGRLPAGLRAILVAPDAEPGDGHPVVVGVSHEKLPANEPLLSPHPAAIALAHLLHPLRPLGLRRVVATVVQPISAVYGKGGFDALFEQTRDILSFQPASTELLPRQFAFNLLHAGDQSRGLESHLGQVLGVDAPISVQLLQGGVFHGLSLSLHVELSSPTTPEAVLEALGQHPLVDFVEGDVLLGPTDAAGREEVLVGRVDADPSSTSAVKIWAVMDNLSRGGALNALGILEALQPKLAS